MEKTLTKNYGVNDMVYKLSTSFMVTVLCSGLLVNCRHDNRENADQSETKQIIGSNDLKVENNSRLRTLIGELTSDGGVCTAFVSGPQEITTALHCIKEQNNLKKAEFIEKLVFKTASGTSSQLTAAAVIDPSKDYLTLNTANVFEEYLRIGKSTSNNLKLVAYDSKSEQGSLVSNNCRIEERIAGSGAFTHNCDTVSGMSGSPMLEGDIVVGLHLGYQDKLDRNAALELSQLDDDKADVRVIGISNEWGVHTRCRESFCKKGPIKLPGLNPAWSGFVIGGPVGALINDRLAAEQKIEEMRRAGAQREAELLSLKLKLNDLGIENQNKTTQLACESAKSGFLPALSALYNSFKTNIEMCEEETSCNNAWSSYKTTSEAIFFSANGQCTR